MHQDRAEVRGSSVRNVRKQREQEQQPRFIVSEGLYELVLFEMLTTESALIASYPVYYYLFVDVIEPPCFARRRWDMEEHNYADKNGDAATDNKDNFPGCHRIAATVRSYIVRDGARAQDGPHAVASKPARYPEERFVRSVVASSDDSESGRNTAFQSS